MGYSLVFLLISLTPVEHLCSGLAAADTGQICSRLFAELPSVQPCACFALAVLPVVLLRKKHPSAAGTNDLTNRVNIPL